MEPSQPRNIPLRCRTNVLAPVSRCLFLARTSVWDGWELRSRGQRSCGRGASSRGQPTAGARTGGQWQRCVLAVSRATAARAGCGGGM